MENKETTREQLLKQLFATHPGVDKFYVTSDDQAFSKEHAAVPHGRTLEDTEVKAYHRIVAETIEKIKDEIVAKNAGASQNATGAATELEIAASATDPKVERAKLVARFIELFDKQPTGLSVEKIQARIAEKEAEPAS